MLKNSSPGVTRVYKTAVFKIHNPSRRKRALLDDALRRNHLAYTKVLRALTANVEAYAAQVKRVRDAAMSRAAAELLTRLPLSAAAKAGVRVDVISQINSYIERRGQNKRSSLPTVQRLSGSPTGYADALDNLARAVSAEEEDAARWRVISEQKHGEFRPILFLRNRRNDGYLFLHHPDSRKYAVYLNLQPEGSRFASETSISSWIDIRTGEVMDFRSRTGCAFPIEFGEAFQHERFLTKGKPQSAMLLKVGAEYRVHVSFVFETQKIETITFLGVQRGISNLLSLCVIDRDGRILHREHVAGRPLAFVQMREAQRQRSAQKQSRRYSFRTRQALATEAVHAAANSIVGAAAKWQSQVVVTDQRSITVRRHKQGWMFGCLFTRGQFEKLEQVLGYKLALAGLPRPAGVGVAGVQHRCPRCGEWDSGNRKRVPGKNGLEPARFSCRNCSYGDDADITAACIIAQKRIWREQLLPEWRLKSTVEIPDEFSFRRFLVDCAARRGDGPVTFRGRDLGNGRTTRFE